MLTGKVAIVTGASSGIGRATALEFVRQGAVVTVTGRNLTALQAIEKELNSFAAGSKTPALVCPGDITKEDDIHRIVESTVSKFGKLDIVVNSAGILKAGAIQDTSVAMFDEVFNTNVRGVFLLSKAAIPHLEKQRGNIVNVSSINGMQSFPGVMAYCSSKAAVDHMTRCAAVDLASKGIRVNCVNPGATRSELQKRGGMSEEAYAAFLERCKVTHPLGRIAEPEEVAKLIAYVASDSAAFITGATIPIDGGRACLGAR